MLTRKLNFFEKLYLRMLMPNLTLYKISMKLTKVINNSALYKVVRRLRRK